jgi:two-component system KDP operon response regulator KdpE
LSREDDDMADPKARIAVIDHDPTFLRLIDRILTLAGYEAIVCPEGTSAHEVVLDNQPDVVMIDTWLATRDEGWVVLQTLRLDDATRGIPILLSTSDAEEVKRRSLEVKAMQNMLILPKPFDPDSLLDAVERLLDSDWDRRANAAFHEPPKGRST